MVMDIEPCPLDGITEARRIKTVDPAALFMLILLECTDTQTPRWGPSNTHGDARHKAPDRHGDLSLRSCVTRLTGKLSLEKVHPDL